MSIATNGDRLSGYLQSIVGTNPVEALKIALAEADRQRSLAMKAAEEYRAMAEVTLDSQGRILSANMGGLYRMARMYSESTIVPKHYQNSHSNCFIALQTALRMKIDPMMYMQNSYIVHGRPGIEAKLAISLMNTSGKIKGRLQFKYERKSGKTVSCECMAVDAESGNPVSAIVTWEMAEREGWTKKEGSKWLTIPEQMFGYRSAMFLARLFYPEVLMGMQTVDELEDALEPAAPTRVAKTLDELEVRGIEGPRQALETDAELGTAPAPVAAAAAVSYDSIAAAIEDATSLSAVEDLSKLAAKLPESDQADLAPLIGSKRATLAGGK